MNQLIHQLGTNHLALSFLVRPLQSASSPPLALTPLFLLSFSSRKTPKRKIPLPHLSGTIHLHQLSPTFLFPPSASMGDPNHPHGQPCLWLVVHISAHAWEGPPLFFHRCHAKGEGKEKKSPQAPSLQKGSTFTYTFLLNVSFYFKIKITIAF